MNDPFDPLPYSPRKGKPIPVYFHGGDMDEIVTEEDIDMGCEFELRRAALLDVEDAKAICGGDGQGCSSFRPYYDNVERRYSKCGRCPMAALANTREALKRIEEGKE